MEDLPRLKQGKKKHKQNFLKVLKNFLTSKTQYVTFKML